MTELPLALCLQTILRRNLDQYGVVERVVDQFEENFVMVLKGRGFAVGDDGGRGNGTG